MCRYTHPFNGPFSGTTRVSRYQHGKTNLNFTEARDSEWQWHQLGHVPFCSSFQTDNHTSTSPLCFLQAGCPSCCWTNSVKALKAPDGCQALSIDPQGYYYYYVVVCLGGVFAGVVSDYLGGRALTCMMMLLFAAPSVNYSVSLLTNRNIF